jgi:subtilase family serine protease
MGYMVRKALAAIGAGALAVPVFAATAGASTLSSDHRVPLRGSSPSWAASSRSAAPTVSGAKSITIRVYLAPRGGEARLNSAVAAVSTPGSAGYRHYLTAAQYRVRFAPTSREVSGIRSWLSASGFRVTGVAAGNRYVEARGRVAAAQRTFGVTIRSYRVGRTVRQAPSSDLSVPSSVAGSVLGVTGLSTPSVVRPARAPAAPPPPGFRNGRPCSLYYGQLVARKQADYSTPLPRFQGAYRDYAVCGYTPVQFRAAYGVAKSGLTGRGVTVAITDAYAAPTIRSDANHYATNHGDAAFTSGQFTQNLPSSFTRQALCGPSGWYGEETLDVEAVHGIAPDAKVRYYGSRSCFDTDFLDTLARVVDENKASYVSNSWGDFSQNTTSGVIAAYEQVFKQGAMQGIGFLYSSGDSGDDLAASGLKQTDYPASDPYITSVGGTSAAIGADGSLQFQAGWGTDKYTLSTDQKSWQPIASNPFLYGAGGGFSSLFNRPSYQQGVIPAGSPAGRAVPDIAMDADPTTGMLIGETQTFPNGTYYDEYRIGGTSLASPLMAGMQALASEKAGGRLGFANPRIYQIERNGGHGFTDVTNAYDGQANVRSDYANGVDPSGGILYSVRTFDDDSSLVTARHWDDVTGVGTPNAGYFTAAAGG